MGKSHKPHKTKPLQRLCGKLAAILNGTASIQNGVCVVSQLRTDLDVTILGRETQSPLVLPVLLSFENFDQKGRALSLGESVLLQEEANTFIRVLQDNGIIVTALHNHWLFEEPRLMYLHWEAIMDPVAFTRAVAQAFRAIGVDFGDATGDETGDETGHETGDESGCDD
mgnify:CR=1 FL=1